jgi:hypothetical protein
MGKRGTAFDDDASMAGPGARPAMLYALLAATDCRIGDLIEFARGMPAEWVEPVCIALGESLRSQARTARHTHRRRRQLVILTTLLSRLTFELSGVPSDPDARI